MDGLYKITGNQMQNFLYPFFWLHGEDGEVLTEYMEKIAAAGMKGVCLEARPHPEFVKDGWWKDLDRIIEKAKELGMKLWILDDSHFPTGFANGKIKECYPQYLKWYLDMRRYDVQGPRTQARIDLKLLKGRPWEKPDETVKVLGVYLAQRELDKTADGDPVKADSMTDITPQMRMEDRLLTLDVPSGAYSIFVVFQTRKGGEDATKDYLNPLVKEATQVLIDEVYEPHYAHYKDEFGKTIMGFFSDEPRFGNTKGTEARIGSQMPLPWREGLETEIGIDGKLLPLLWTEAGGAEKSVRFQYMDTVTRLYNQNFTKMLGDWCRGHGVLYLGHNIEDNGAHARLGYGAGHYFRAQQDMDAAGIDVIGTQIVPGMDYHHDAFSTGGSDGEFYHYALAKLAASAAHLDPKKEGRAMCEAFGAYGWNEGLKTMKWIADHLMVRGINYLVPHAFDPKEFPDWDCPPHFYAHGHNPQFRYFSVFSDYVNRVMSLFRGGVYPAKAGLFYPAETEWAGRCMPVEKPARMLSANQISFDIVSRDYFMDARIEAGAYVINGVRFEALVFPYGECFPADMLPKLEQMADAGVRLIFTDKVPEALAGFGQQAEDLEKLHGIIEKCEVVPLESLGTALREYQAIRTETPQPYLAVYEYSRGGRQFYMLFNESIGQSVETAAAFQAEGYAYRYDALSDTVYEETQDDHKIHINLQPYESAVYIFSKEPVKDACADEQIKNRKKGKGTWEMAPLPEHWQAGFADSLSYPEFKETVPLEQLGFVHMCDGFEDKAGTVYFQTEMDFGGAEEAVLDLGEVHETAEVFVDGISAGVRLCRPYVFDIGRLIKPETKEHTQTRKIRKIRIEVTNTLGTSIREPMSHYLVIEPFGIEGPVRLWIKKKGES